MNKLLWSLAVVVPTLAVAAVGGVFPCFPQISPSRSLMFGKRHRELGAVTRVVPQGL